MKKTKPTESTAKAPVHGEAFTAESNPTSRCGRGEPSLEDQFRPAAWVYIDGNAGKYTEEDGNPQVQWVIEEPVSGSATFRVEVFEPLLGTPTSFRCVIQTIDTEGGAAVVYSFKAEDGTFEVGRDYSLVNPGKDFAIRNRMSGDAVAEMPPLVPGEYLMAAGIRNDETEKDALAITYFTVGQE